MNPDFVIKGKEVFLSRKERELFELLNTDRSKIFSREEIQNIIWKTEKGNSVEVYINYLRNKIGAELVINQRERGYYLSIHCPKPLWSITKS